MAQSTNIDNFIPPPRVPQVADWATYIPDRRPNFKTHKNRGQGLNALNAGGNGPRTGILYHYENDAWQEKSRVDSLYKPPDCERCGNTLTKTIAVGNKTHSYYYADWQWNKETLKLEATCGRKCSNVFQCKMTLEENPK